MNLFEAIVLGLIQGLTEFLPVSSSGHLEIGKALFELDKGKNFYFTIAVHGATVLSTIVVFRKELADLIRGVFKFRMNEETGYVLRIFVSMIPLALVGFFLKEEVEGLYNGNMLLIGLMLLVTSLLLTIGHFASGKGRSISYRDAFIIGLAQAFAAIPGISRSGATIATGMMLGNRKDELARFSFLMVLIPILGANFLEIVSSTDKMTESLSPAVLIAGTLTAFISGYAACRWMINIVRKSKMIWFAAYCLVVGLLTILFL
ncbi:MAG: undecaprenyl-diphosphate phosphatase [Bacteroidales bacterium]|jgi:undecaprenyl-diphosphatase|nr:undecaprenyl-diphosphate phosphatase [Bacteroidales bacterium]MDI9553452.1 undecaprenyl-diphosphate phosphatase [Bacteroidota bacterium]